MVYIQCVVRFDLVPLSKKSYLKQLLKNINSLGKLDIWLPKLCWLQRPNQERQLSQNKPAKKWPLEEGDPQNDQLGEVRFG